MWGLKMLDNVDIYHCKDKLECYLQSINACFG